MEFSLINIYLNLMIIKISHHPDYALYHPSSLNYAHFHHYSSLGELAADNDGVLSTLSPVVQTISANSHP